MMVNRGLCLATSGRSHPVLCQREKKGSSGATENDRENLQLSKLNTIKIEKQ